MEIVDKILSGEKAISSSALKEAKKSTRDFLYYYEKPKETKLHFDFGNAIELWIINKTEFHKQVAIMDESKRPFPDKNYQTVANKDWKAKFYADNSDKYIIPAKGEDSFEVIMELEALAQKHPYYEMLVSPEMNYQDPFEWICPRTGLKRYARTDLFSAHHKVIVDIKTDNSNDFERACRNNDHFLQAFDQISGALHSGKMDIVTDYYWFVFGKSKPYFVDVYRYPIDLDMKIEESHTSVLLRLKRDLEAGMEDVVWHEAPVIQMKVPNYYE